MKKTYKYELNLPKEETEKILKERGKANKISVNLKKDEVIIMEAYKLFNLIPIKGQIGFKGNIYTESSKTMIKGSFDAPSVFYKIAMIMYAITWLIFLILSKTCENILFNTILSATICYLLIKIYVKLSIHLFYKQNRNVLKFLESFEKDYIARIR